MTESLFLNPAAIAHAQGSFFGFYYFNGDIYFDDSRSLAISIVDNHSGALVPAGLGYFRNTRVEGSKSVIEQHLELAVGDFVRGQFAFGSSLKWLNQEIVGEETNSHWNLNLGLHWNPSPVLGLGLVYYNPLKFRKNSSLGLFSEVAAGLIFLPYNFIRLRFDVSKEFHSEDSLEPKKEALKFKWGLESSINRSMVVRFGYQNRYEFKVASAGFSLITPRFTIDYSISKVWRGDEGFIYKVGLRIP